MNLVSNALEAIPVKGHVTISTENCYIDRPVKGYDVVNEGDYVALTVKDTGSGLSSEDFSRIFEPFYTRKKMGRSGTGFNCSIFLLCDLLCRHYAFPLKFCRYQQ